ncbi:MAG: carbamoyltransferase HypF [Cyanobacteriota bacterium]|nr:carbamoyltransferase HypF [Cyanobacteriota bacterium]
MAVARLQLDCRGVVQGVGFRPLVHRLASELALVGQLENVAGGVQLLLQGERSHLEQLVQRLPQALPAAAVLESMQAQWLPPLTPAPQGLSISAAAALPLGAGWLAQALVADLAPCAACLAELRDPADRRYRYPFISCAHCGPRFSIATAEPYARAHTTLAAFALCGACQREFDDPAGRRFHAETIACPDCGPQLRWHDSGGTAVGGGEAALQAAAALLRRGQILALQGVGGVQLLVDARNADAIAQLRQRKGRPRKPLALLVATADWVSPWAVLNGPERQLLESPAAPIVLLRRRQPHAAAGPAPQLPDGLAPGSAELGVMLPASPLHQLLVEAFGAPLVCTSGNPSGEPLCLDWPEAWRRLGPQAAGGQVADGWLVHNRPIARGLDDSLVRLAAGRPQLLRRARGYAPLPLTLPPWAQAPGWMLALGGDLKAAPALADRDRLWLAPQLGDLADGGVHTLWQRGLGEVLDRHGASLQTIVSDRHPHYLSQQWARRWAGAVAGRRQVGVQHHQAHGLAVLAEHGAAPPALLLACDGLGHGWGAVPLWGCEGLLLGADGGLTRLMSLRPLRLPGGGLALQQPRRVALALLAELGPAALQHPGARASRAAFAPAERAAVLQALAAGCVAPCCSSLGRLVDGVASLLDLVQQLSYEGEGGLLLQGAAEQALSAASAEPLVVERLPLQPAPAMAGVPLWLDWQPLLRALLHERAIGVPVAISALRVHRALAAALTAWAQQAAAATGLRTVVLAGGCFQNRLLLEDLVTALRAAGLRPLWPQQLPCGDGGLALGQVAAARLAQRRPPT